MHYYKRNIGDYSKKAGRLSILQHGVYNLLIDACYDRERFPTREDAIDWIWASSPEEIQAVDFVLGKFFDLEGNIYIQKRIQEEIIEYQKFCDEQAAKGKKGGRPKGSKKKPDGLNKKPDGLFEEPDGNPPVTQRGRKKTLTTNQEPLTTNQTNTSTPNGAGVPVQKIVDLYHEVLTDLPAVRQITSKRKAQIQQRWRSSPKHQDLDFWRRYFDFVSQSPFLMGQIPPTPERPKPFRADLEWLTNESNFTKVIENRYHG